MEICFGVTTSSELDWFLSDMKATTFSLFPGFSIYMARQVFELTKISVPKSSVTLPCPYLVTKVGTIPRCDSTRLPPFLFFLSFFFFFLLGFTTEPPTPKCNWCNSHAKNSPASACFPTWYRLFDATDTAWTNMCGSTFDLNRCGDHMLRSRRENDLANGENSS